MKTCQVFSLLYCEVSTIFQNALPQICFFKKNIKTQSWFTLQFVISTCTDNSYHVILVLDFNILKFSLQVKKSEIKLGPNYQSEDPDYAVWVPPGSKILHPLSIHQKFQMVSQVFLHVH